MLFGGSRSGKTFIALRCIVIRASKVKSRHLVARLRFTDIKRAVIMDTFPKMMELCFPELEYNLNKTDWYVTFPNGSEIWFGGLDTAERMEKVLGNEYSTIYCNESSQIEYEAILILITRLAENSGLSPRFMFDCNPPTKAHWTYLKFIKGVDPMDRKTPIEDWEETHGALLMNPKDNLDNLPAHYIKSLRSLPERQRKRFLEGMFLDDVEGALWKDPMLERARSLARGEIVKSVVSVDPSVSNNPDSDECGIIVAGVDDLDNGHALADYTGKLSTKAWAEKAVWAYHEHDCNEIVYESNQGGDLVRDALQAVDPNVPLVAVRASKGKFARAEPVTVFYEERDPKGADMRQIGHASHEDGTPLLVDLEEEMATWIPDRTRESPNRIDALVWAMTHLLINRPNAPWVYIPD